MDPTPVKLVLDRLHCYDEGDGPGSAEPYLWTVFFKLDGETVSITPQLALSGTATVITTGGNHGDLGSAGADVDPGENIPIPPALGQFSTVSTPIPRQNDPGTFPGVVGCVVVLMEQDKTSNHAIAQGHAALNAAVQQALNDLIPTLHFGHTSPSDDEIKALTDSVGDKVESAISDNVSAWDWLSNFGNMDDKVGTAVFYRSQGDIIRALYDGIPLQKIWNNEGRWQLDGRVFAEIADVAVSCIHKPGGNPESHHIEQFGGSLFGETWRASNHQVMRWIQNGQGFHVDGANGSRAAIEVRRHWTSNANPSGLYLATHADGTHSDNLLSLPDCDVGADA